MNMTATCRKNIQSLKIEKKFFQHPVIKARNLNQSVQLEYTMSN